jgi:hypothetical protein
MNNNRHVLIAVTTLAAALSSAAPAFGMSGQFDTCADGARTAKYNVYTDGATSGKLDTFVDGAKAGKFDTYTDGARYYIASDRSAV